MKKLEDLRHIINLATRPWSRQITLHRGRNQSDKDGCKYLHSYSNHIILHLCGCPILPSCYPWSLKMFTSKMAADMPSETELLTTAKHLFMAACSSCWLLSRATKIPAVLKKHHQSPVLGDSGFTQAWMMLKGSDKLRAANMAALCATCTERRGR